MHEGTLQDVTREQILRYAAAVDDFNPIHVDESFARGLGLPSVVAHGPLTVTLVLDALVAAGPAAGITGLDARLRAPVLPGDALSWQVEDRHVEVRNASGVVVASMQLERKET